MVALCLLWRAMSCQPLPVPRRARALPLASNTPSSRPPLGTSGPSALLRLLPQTSPAECTPVAACVHSTYTLLALPRAPHTASSPLCPAVPTVIIQYTRKTVFLALPFCPSPRAASAECVHDMILFLGVWRSFENVMKFVH